MEYICADRGTDRCPCVLMEAGRCYTCGMSSGSSADGGKCACKASWQGSCPYTEFLQNGRRPAPAARWQRFRVRQVERFSEELTAATLDTPLGFAADCRRAGAFVMVKAAGVSFPLSVMNAEIGAKPCIRLAFSVAGPKTAALAAQLEAEGSVSAAGPFSNGLLNAGVLGGGNAESPLFAVCKGLAAVPLINAAGAGLFSGYEGRQRDVIFLDSSKLTEDFLGKYWPFDDYERVRLAEDTERETKRIAAAYEILKERAAPDFADGSVKPTVFLMVSPYFQTKLLDAMGLAEDEAVVPNHANMCCGEGLCGACSYTDEDGVTVRGCKCAAKAK